MVNPIKKMNNYFLSDVEEEIDKSDYIWFYGSYGASIGVIAVIVLMNYI